MISDLSTAAHSIDELLAMRIHESPVFDLHIGLSDPIEHMESGPLDQCHECTSIDVRKTMADVSKDHMEGMISAMSQP